eukprot:GHVR01081766.1.p1 GENE.GHVR01081766.1~~GHVR01081766.1.p1  ORF type:complete len:110 (+),score=15.24 GHVR01081766.1:40-369(+)
MGTEHSHEERNTSDIRVDEGTNSAESLDLRVNRTPACSNPPCSTDISRNVFPSTLQAVDAAAPVDGEPVTAELKTHSLMSNSSASNNTQSPAGETWTFNKPGIDVSMSF